MTLEAPVRTIGGVARIMQPSATPSLPPLENGDRLTRHEFERRYRAMPRVKKAELIEGVVKMSSPVHQRSHSQPHASVVGFLAAYYAATPGVDLGDNATVRLDAYNEVQPDGLLRLEPAAGGRSRISPDDYIEGPPELIVEVAASSASQDLHDKLRVYCRNGVQEYIVWQVHERRLDWFVLDTERDDYVPLAPDADGIIRSRVFPGLHLPVQAMLDGDLAQVLTVLQRGCALPEHAQFVVALRA
jgi:Uma2 family endonuclease